MILGADYSHWDFTLKDPYTGGRYYVPINYQVAISNGVRYVFLKACNGATDTACYKDAMRDARAAGLLAAPYVWLYPDNNVSVRLQADFWYSRLKDEKLLVIDIEVTPTDSGNVFPDFDDLYGAIVRLRELGFTGRIMIYTGHYYWLTYGSPAEYWKQYPVWLARYAAYPPQITPPWTGYTFWQFSSKGDPALYGVTNGKDSVDLNRFEGTQEELETLFGGAALPPTTGEPDMYQGTCITASLNVRNAPSTGAVVGGLALNDKVEADRVENGWWHLTKIRGVATTGENWSYEGATKNYIRTDAITQPPVGERTVTVTVQDGALTGSAVITLK